MNDSVMKNQPDEGQKLKTMDTNRYRVIKIDKSEIVLTVIFGLVFGLLGAYLLYNDLNDNVFNLSKDGSHRYLYILVLAATVGASISVTRRYFRQMIVDGNKLHIHRFKKATEFLVPDEIGIVEIMKPRRRRPDHTVIINDKRGKAIFDEGLSRADSDWLENYFKEQRVFMIVHPGFE